MVRSMTGYGRCEVQTEERDILIELRAVNHRYFEFSLRIPRSYAFLEDKIKAFVQNRVKRGKVDVFVTVKEKQTTDCGVSVNHPLAKGYVDAISELAETYGAKSDLSASVLARFPEVLTVEKQPQDEDKIYSEFLPVLEGAVDGFVKMREVEGERLKNDVLTCLSNIESNVAYIEKRQPEIVSEYYGRLKEKLEEILGDMQVNEQRIVTEAAIFADKTAVAEETVRLKSHIAQIRDMMELDEPIGRKLDFIVQECNRESNTIGSKCQNLEITKIVVNLKSEIEKIREQIQNIE